MTAAAVALQELVDATVEANRNRIGALLPVLHDIQDKLGYVPPDAVPMIARALNLSRAEVHGVITFYTDFRSEPRPTRTVRICRAEACQAVGAQDLVDAAEGRAEQVFCLGNCALGPSVEVDGRVVGRVTPDRLREVLS